MKKNQSNNISKIQLWQALPNVFRILIRIGRQTQSNAKTKIDTWLVFPADSGTI